MTFLTINETSENSAGCCLVTHKKKTKRKPTLIPRQTVSPTVLGTKKLRVSFFYKDFISTNPPKAFMA